jgi:ribosomal protein S18 acetylase RimI-like enzyme
MQIRNIVVEDYFSVSSVINDWWGGRPMTHLLPRLFFEHFQPTSFVIETENELVAFIIGFISQTKSNHAYIHFVGVNPNYRKQGHANHLYDLFFNTVKVMGCNEVYCITTPVNTGSIAFHKAIGFDAQLTKDYAGEGQDRIVFSKCI